MLPANGGVDGEKIVDGFARLQKVDERLRRHARLGEAGRYVHDLLVDGHHARQLARSFALPSTDSTIGDQPPWAICADLRGLGERQKANLHPPVQCGRDSTEHGDRVPFIVGVLKTANH